MWGRDPLTASYELSRRGSAQTFARIDGWSRRQNPFVCLSQCLYRGTGESPGPCKWKTFPDKTIAAGWPKAKSVAFPNSGQEAAQVSVSSKAGEVLWVTEVVEGLLFRVVLRFLFLLVLSQIAEIPQQPTGRLFD